MSMTPTPVDRPRRPDWAFGAYCEIRDVTATRTVRISARAANTMQAEVADFYGRRELYGMTRETGGSCMGRRQVPDRDIEITEAGLPGSDTRTGSGWLRLGAESWLRMHHDHAPRGLVENAAWHSHPPGSRGEPSRADLKAWQTNLETARKYYGYQVDRFVGIIVTPGNTRGTDSTIHAWIVTDHGDRYATAELALVKIGDTRRPIRTGGRSQAVRARAGLRRRLHLRADQRQHLSALERRADHPAADGRRHPLVHRDLRRPICPDHCRSDPRH